MGEFYQFVPLIIGLVGAGVLGGLIAGLLGVGGGIVLVPAMALAFELLGYNPDIYHHVAVGTSLAIIIMTGTTSALAHHRRGAVMFDVLKIWLPFIMISSFLGGLMAGMFSGGVLRIIFGVIAFFIALNIILPIQKTLMERLSGSTITHRISAFIIGYISALMGIGGGSLSVPTLVAFGHSIHKSVGTSAALGVLIAVPGAIGFIISGWGVAGRVDFSFGYVNIPALVLIGLVASAFAPMGAALAHKLDAKKLKLVFAIFLCVVSARMIFQAFGG
jgi:uncharacterized membrane protein YfcA